MIEKQSFPKFRNLLIVSLQDEDHIVKCMKITPLFENCAGELFQILPTESTCNYSSVEPIQIYHGFNPYLLIHRLIVKFIDLMILLNGFLDALIVRMIISQSFAILPQ